MARWTKDELSLIAGTREVQLAAGDFHFPMVTVWLVRYYTGLYVRSSSPENAWFVRAWNAGVGQLLAGGFRKHVRFSVADTYLAEELDKAYVAKYDRDDPMFLDLVGPAHVAATLRVDPLN